MLGAMGGYSAMKRMLRCSGCLALLAAFPAMLWAQGPASSRRPAQPPPRVASQPRYEDASPSAEEPLTTEERVNIAVYEKANRSVVNITTKASKEALLVFEVPMEGSGSGSVLNKHGHILTNYHVIEGAQHIKVALHTGNSYDAEVVGKDPPNDIAVLKIDAPADDLSPIEFGDSGRLKVGQHIYAIGNPFGLERTLTRGIISSLNRSLPSRGGRTMRSIIQIDAALNRGNSGGPLLSSSGKLIGMNTAIASSTGENTGVGFAIPVNTIARVVPQLIQSGKVVRPDIGISRVYESEDGLLIATLIPGGPAERAGLRGFQLVNKTTRRGPFVYEAKTVDRSAADRVVSVDGEKVKTADDLLSLIEAHRPGEEVTVGILRQGQEFAVRVLLGGE
jgi:S1-C subfamily serine protease